MTKIILTFLTLINLSLFSHAGPRVIGNGGDVKEEDPVSVALVQSHLTDARLFIVSWLHGLEGQMKLDNGLKGTYPRQLPIPAGAEKLFTWDPDHRPIYHKIWDIKILFKTKSPCPSDTKASDGSVISVKPAIICISGYNLARKLNEANAKIQLEALILHEISHLVGTSETEATAIQAQYLEDMRSISKESIFNYSKNVIETLYSMKNYYVPQLITLADDQTELCKKILQLRGLIATAASYSEITPISLFTADDRDSADALSTVIGQVLHLKICGAGQNTPNWLKEYEKGFGDKKRVTLFEWQKNRGTVEPRKISGQVVLTKIENKDDLVQQLLMLNLIADPIVTALLSDIQMSFEIELGEK